MGIIWILTTEDTRLLAHGTRNYLKTGCRKQLRPPCTVTPFQAKVAQLSAHHAVNNPYKITPIEVSEDSWRTIASYFYPPKEYEYSFHGYRTPLQFYDGTPL